MILAHLRIQNLRNIKSLQVNLHPHLNIITGANGSGKTSFLEAVYLLGSGHSFRTREISPLVNCEADYLTVFARTSDEQSVSIQKSLSSSTQVKLNNQPCHSNSELAHFLPCQVLYQDIFQIINAGPASRRSLLDWGLFHVEQNYHSLWKNYNRALKQRNALLRQKAKPTHIEPWNQALDQLATELDFFRNHYFEEVNKAFQKMIRQLTTIDCSLTYYKGWDKKGSKKSLATILTENYQSDVIRQFTHYGAHHADLYIEANDFKAKQFLSRGQQKIILIALKLAQTLLMSDSCIFLCDDLSSELDSTYLAALFELIKNMKGQFFITVVDEKMLPLDKCTDYSIFSLN